MKILTAAISLLGLLSFQFSVFTQGRIVTAPQVNGTWQLKYNTFKIRALGKRRLRIEFSGLRLYQLADGRPVASTGEARGTAVIEGRRAIFKPDGSDDECLITLEFVGRRLEVKQVGMCGFGHNVTASGVYRKVSARPPRSADN